MLIALQTKVAFKIYTDSSPDAVRAFEKEVEIFDTIRESAGELIVKYLGSFTQNRKNVVVMEYADGNLRDFFGTHRGPRDNAELIYLWTALFKLADAVYQLHHAGSSALGM
jgi:serine/threonine protein kinase